MKFDAFYLPNHLKEFRRVQFQGHITPRLTALTAGVEGPLIRLGDVYVSEMICENNPKNRR
jgi:hypothetical protein